MVSVADICEFLQFTFAGIRAPLLPQPRGCPMRCVPMPSQSTRCQALPLSPAFYAKYTTCFALLFVPGTRCYNHAHTVFVQPLF